MQKRDKRSHGYYSHKRAIALRVTVEVINLLQDFLHKVRFFVTFFDGVLAINEITDCRRAGIADIKGIIADPSAKLKSNVFDNVWLLRFEILCLIELQQPMEKMIGEFVVIGVLTW